MKLKRLVLLVILAIAVPLDAIAARQNNSQSGAGDALSTTQIVTESLNLQCMEWRIIGFCLWLLCTPYSCTTKESPKYHHFNPDLVISGYESTGENPWQDVASYSSERSEAGGIGQMEGGKDQVRPSDMKYMNADAIGHPGDLSVISEDKTLCRRATTPFVPYFLSTLDAFSWRTGRFEQFYPGTLIPGLHEIGRLYANHWGNVYPRQGFVVQQDDRKAASVAAFRAGSIVSDPFAPHFYFTTAQSSSNQGWWPPGRLKENDRNNHKWQRLYPNLSQNCEIFADQMKISMTGDDMDYPVTPKHGYVWALWRPYSCCERKGQTLLFSTPAPGESQ